MQEEDHSIVHEVSLAAAVGRRALPRRLCTAFARSLGAQHATMSLLPRLEQWQLLHASDEAALRVEAAQFAHADGPSVDAAMGAAMGARSVFVSEDVAEDGPGEPGPRWCDALPDLRSALALALHRHGRPVGVICLYFTRTTTVTAAHIAEAERAATLAREELLRWRPVHACAAGAQPVWATDTRAARWKRIHQAAGCLAAREDCDVDEALAWLRATSTRRRQSLLDTCDLILQPVTARSRVDREAVPATMT